MPGLEDGKATCLTKAMVSTGARSKAGLSSVRFQEQTVVVFYGGRVK